MIKETDEDSFGSLFREQIRLVQHSKNVREYIECKNLGECLYGNICSWRGTLKTTTLIGYEEEQWNFL